MDTMPADLLLVKLTCLRSIVKVIMICYEMYGYKFGTIAVTEISVHSPDK